MWSIGDVLYVMPTGDFCGACEAASPVGICIIEDLCGNAIFVGLNDLDFQGLDKFAFGIPDWAIASGNSYSKLVSSESEYDYYNDYYVETTLSDINPECVLSGKLFSGEIAEMSMHNIPGNKYINLTYASRWCPAASFAHRYKCKNCTGEWYLPSIYELMSAIVFQDHCEHLPLCYKKLAGNESYVSSTLHSIRDVYHVNMPNRTVISEFCNMAYNVRPFIQIKNN